MLVFDGGAGHPAPDGVGERVATHATVESRAAARRGGCVGVVAVFRAGCQMPPAW
jgi:hypothetical protein